MANERTWQISDIDGKNKRTVTLAQYRAELDAAKARVAPVVAAFYKGNLKAMADAQAAVEERQMTPQSMINEAENKAAEFQLAKMAADMGCAPRDWNTSHPCEFGVFQKGRDGYAVAPLFPAVFADMRRDGFRCVFRTDQGEV